MQGIHNDDPAISAKITAMRLSEADERARGFLLIVGDAQPLSEDLEIAGYATFALLALWCRRLGVVHLEWG
jgi:hypothetical protein